MPSFWANPKPQSEKNSDPGGFKATPFHVLKNHQIMIAKLLNHHVLEAEILLKSIPNKAY